MNKLFFARKFRKNPVFLFVYTIQYISQYQKKSSYSYGNICMFLSVASCSLIVRMRVLDFVKSLTYKSVETVIIDKLFGGFVCTSIYSQWNTKMRHKWKITT